MANSSDFKVGAIVALKSHPFFSEEANINLHISGEALHISPMMIVIETVRERKPRFEETSGMNLADTDTYQCKCIWYSSKVQQFEESWISSKQLKVISKAADEQQNALETLVVEIGDNVTLKTAPLEIRKEKSHSERVAYNNSQEKNKKITPLLSFLPPTMVVIGTGNYEPKEPIVDSKTGIQVRWYSEKQVKCKYYNAQSDKFSEVYLPSEALMPIPKVNAVDLKKISKGKTVVMEINGEVGLHDRTLRKFGDVIYKGGFYYVEIVDEIYNSREEIRVDQIGQIIREFNDDSPEFSKYRKVTVTKDGKRITKAVYRRIHDLSKILSKSKPNVYFRIEYVGKYSGVKSIRYISNCSVLETNEIVAEDVVVAYCHKKKAERHFLLDQIQNIKVYDLNDRIEPKAKVKKKEHKKE